MFINMITKTISDSETNATGTCSLDINGNGGLNESFQSLYSKYFERLPCETLKVGILLYILKIVKHTYFRVILLIC